MANGMRLRRLVSELSEMLAKHGDVEVVMETVVYQAGGPDEQDENSIERVEAFKVCCSPGKGEMVVALCSKEVEL